MKAKSTYQELENKIVELQKQNKILHMKSSFQNEEKSKRIDELVIANNDKNRFQKILDALDAVVYVADMDTYELLFLNKKGKKLTGDKLVQKCYLALQKGQTKPCEFCTNHLLLDNDGKPKQPYVWEFQNTVTNRWYQLSDQAIHWTDDKLVRIEIAIDITERKEAEFALKESEEKFRQLFRNMSSGVAIYEAVDNGTDFCFKNFNIAAEKIENIPKEKIIGNTITKVFPNAKEFGFLDVFKRVWETGISEHFPISFYQDKRITGWRENYVYKLNSGEIVAIYDDITERKQAEQALKESEAKLKESNATKDKFFSIIAHDLKSPFNSMIGFSEVLNEKFDEYNIEKQKKFISIINQELQGTYKLLENLLYWSRSQRGTIDFKPERLNLYLLVNETNKLLVNLAQNKSINLINQIPENINVEADRDMLLSIIRNLISNAIKFTPKCGEISIKAKLTKDDKFVKILVIDSGVGISKETQSKLFDIGENTTTKGTENETGTGLGLILCKEFVERHGGEIWVESELKKGATFNFTLPNNIVENINKNKDSNTKLETGAKKTPTILVVEDEEPNYQYVEAILEKGFKLVHAINGKEGIELFNSNDIDLILMDIKMPIMDGIEATKEIKKTNKEIPIIALTAFAMAEDKKNALKAGCNYFLSKPVNRNQLLETINNHLKAT